MDIEEIEQYLRDNLIKDEGFTQFATMKAAMTSTKLEDDSDMCRYFATYIDEEGTEFTFANGRCIGTFTKKQIQDMNKKPIKVETKVRHVSEAPADKIYRKNGNTMKVYKNNPWNVY